MEIKYQKHSKRLQKATDFWLKVAAEYNAGLTAKDIAEKYVNPVSGRHYTREHIYWILKKLQKGI